MRARHALQIKLSQFDGSKRLAGDEFAHVSIEPAAVGKLPFNPIQAALPFLYRWFGAQAMFKEQKTSARFQPAMHFSEGSIHVVDAAQRKRADDTIERAISERQPLAADQMLANLDARPPDAPLGQAIHPNIWIGGPDLAHVIGIVSQIQTGAETDFEYVPLSADQ